MIIIRPARIEEIGDLQRLNQEVFVDSVKYDPDLAMDWAISEKGKAFFTKMLTNPDSHCLVAQDNDVLAGYIALAEKKLEYRKSRCVEIENLGVTPSYQSKGIGSMLIQKAREWAKEKGYQKMYVSCYFKNTRALSFYRKNGMAEIDVGLERDL